MIYSQCRGELNAPGYRRQSSQLQGFVQQERWQRLLKPIAAHCQTSPNAIQIEPIQHGTRQRENVCRLIIGTKSYLLKQHDITAPAVEAGHTPLQTEATVLSTLHRSGCRVPKVVWKSDPLQALLLEWCGEDTLDILAQRHQSVHPPAVVQQVVKELCQMETSFLENAEFFKPYVFGFDSRATLERLLEQGKRTLGYLLTPVSGKVQNAWHTLSARLLDAPTTLGALDYNARNVVVANGKPTFIDFASIGWDWQERRLVQLLNSIGAFTEGANFVSLLDRELVHHYATWVATHRETLAPSDIAARVDAHHLLFYMSVVHRLLRAAARTETVDSQMLLHAWGDTRARFQRALTLIATADLSDDVNVNVIRTCVCNQFNRQ